MKTKNSNSLILNSQTLLSKTHTLGIGGNSNNNNNYHPLNFSYIRYSLVSSIQFTSLQFNSSTKNSHNFSGIPLALYSAVLCQYITSNLSFTLSNYLSLQTHCCCLKFTTSTNNTSTSATTNTSSSPSSSTATANAPLSSFGQNLLVVGR